MRNALLILQALTFLGLGTALLTTGEWRLAVAQYLLAIITVVIYG